MEKERERVSKKKYQGGELITIILIITMMSRFCHHTEYQKKERVNVTIYGLWYIIFTDFVLIPLIHSFKMKPFLSPLNVCMHSCLLQVARVPLIKRNGKTSKKVLNVSKSIFLILSRFNHQKRNGLQFVILSLQCKRSFATGKHWIHFSSALLHQGIGNKLRRLLMNGCCFYCIYSNEYLINNLIIFM